MGQDIPAIGVYQQKSSDDLGVYNLYPTIAALNNNA
jgi:hypothetical protein